MISDGYNILAGDYDILNSHIDYESLCDYYERLFKEYHPGDSVSKILDIGCGTGSLMKTLGIRGYSVIGIDSSDEMLSIADQKIREYGIKNSFLLNGDMSSFMISEQVDAVINSFDGINHLLCTEDIMSCFTCVNSSLGYGGLFIFDVNTPHKFRTQFDDADYIIDTPDVFCGWHTQLNSKKNVSDFYINVFRNNGSSGWSKYTGYIRERSYSVNTRSKCLSDCGFKVLHISGGYNNTSPAPDSDRWYFISSKVSEIL